MILLITKNRMWSDHCEASEIFEDPHALVWKIYNTRKKPLSINIKSEVEVSRYFQRYDRYRRLGCLDFLSVGGISTSFNSSVFFFLKI